MASGFEAAQDSIDWANEEIEKLKTDIDAFFNDDRNSAFVDEFNPDTGEYSFIFRILTPIPKSFRKSATIALGEIKNSFDKALFGAIKHHTPSARKSVYFPWSKNPTDLDHLLKARPIPEVLYDAIRIQHPYPTGDTYSGGDDLVRSLATLANTKHTVGLSIVGHVSGHRISIGHNSGVNVFTLAAQPAWDPKKQQIELLRYTRNKPPLDENTSVRLQIVLQDAGGPKVMDVRDVLSLFAEVAQRNVKLLKGVCS